MDLKKLDPNAGNRLERSNQLRKQPAA